jgi:hypothetical protein
LDYGDTIPHEKVVFIIVQLAVWTTGGEWVGIYQRPYSISPDIVVQTKERFSPRLGTGSC